MLGMGSNEWLRFVQEMRQKAAFSHFSSAPASRFFTRPWNLAPRRFLECVPARRDLHFQADRNGRVIVYGRDDLDRVTSEQWYSNATPAPNVAIATTTQGGSVNEVQRVGYTNGMIFGGTFTITHDGQTTSPIAHNATAATVKSALEGLSSVGSGNVDVVQTQSGTFTYEWRITFQGSKAGTNVVQSTIDTTGISAMGGVTKIEATDTTGGVFDEVQTVTVNNATGGVFRLAFMGQTTAPIAYNASAATVETALESLNSVDNVNVTGSAGGPWTITFAGSHAGYNVSTITGDASMLTNGTLERTMSFVYDAASQLTSTTDPDSTYTYSYDALGRVTSVDNDGTSGVPRVILASAYDSASNRTSLAATIAGTADFKNDYTYDALHRLTRLDQTGQGGGNAVAEKRVDFAYNGLGQFTAIARFKDTDGGSTHEVATSSFTFDTLNRLTGLAYKKGGTDLFTPYSFSYDTLGRITSTTNQDGTTDYTYDKTSQLTAANHSYQTDEAYTFDANGNRTMTGYTTGSNNRLTSDGTYNYTYDNEGNRTLRTKISDGSKTEYGWDYRNRLIRITEKTSGGTVTKESLYTYDQFDRRLSKSVAPDGPGGASAVISRFIYDGDNIVLVFGGSSASDLKNRYLHGPAVDQILADEQVTSLGSAGSVLWPLADNQGTIRDLVNSSGVVQNHLEYDSFGAVTAESNSAVDHHYGYTGRERDEESGLMYYRARYYDPNSGAFISIDPYGFHAGDENLARYVGNDPANRIDPSGLEAAPIAHSYEELANSVSIGPSTHGRTPWIEGMKQFGPALIDSFSDGAAWDSFQGAVMGYIDYNVGTATFGLAPNPSEYVDPLYGHELAYDNGVPVGVMTAQLQELAASLGAPSAGVIGEAADGVRGLGDLGVGVATGNTGQAVGGGLSILPFIPGGGKRIFSKLPKDVIGYVPWPKLRPPECLSGLVCFVAGTPVLTAMEDGVESDETDWANVGLAGALLIGAVATTPRRRRKSDEEVADDVFASFDGDWTSRQRAEEPNDDFSALRPSWQDVPRLARDSSGPSASSELDVSEEAEVEIDREYALQPPVNRSRTHAGRTINRRFVRAARLAAAPMLLVAGLYLALTSSLFHASPKVELPRSKPIEELRVGDRVVTDAPAEALALSPESNTRIDASEHPLADLAPNGTNVDSKTWKKLRLYAEVRWPDGTLDDIHVETLQPLEWIATNDIRVGGKSPVPLDLVEMGMPQEVLAEVIAIEQCPPVAPGLGRVVLTTIDHLNSDVFTLRYCDNTHETETLRVTGSHKFYSITHDAWVSARHLKPNELLDGIYGPLTIASVQSSRGTERVCNVTVEGEHVYRVGTAGVLVHNANCFDMHHGIPKEIIKNAPSHIDPKDIRGGRGNPNRVPIDRIVHQAAHNGGANGGQPRYNEEFQRRLDNIPKTEGRPLTPQDYWDIRERMLWEYLGR
jgi:RHS repeat-associated protein